jgi:alanyl-tRNA synthetase
MTIRLYEKDVYLRETTCNIIERIENGDKKLLVLDKTIFFPEGGGQPSDTGFIGNSSVSHVFEEDNIIYHQVEKMPIGQDQICTIDWDRRFDFMQQHCGEHILSGVVLDLYGYANKGFHLGEEYVTADFDGEIFDEAKIDFIEEQCNKAIYENRPVVTDVLDSTVKAIQYKPRKTPELDEALKVVYIDGIDSVACCGTHPAMTGEVGLLKIMKTQRYKGMTRVFFKCGKRARTTFNEEHKVIKELGEKYSSDLVHLVHRISRESDWLIETKKQLQDCMNERIDEEIKDILNDNPVGIVVLSYEGFKGKVMDSIVKKLINQKSLIVLATSREEKRLILAHDGSYGQNCGGLLKVLLTSMNGKGGGGPKWAHATFQSDDDLIQARHRMEELIEEKME